MAQCNRTACRKDGANSVHSHYPHNLYCAACARGINRHNPENPNLVRVLPDDDDIARGHRLWLTINPYYRVKGEVVANPNALTHTQEEMERGYYYSGDTARARVAELLALDGTIAEVSGV
jgi:hypothetical protein